MKLVENSGEKKEYLNVKIDELEIYKKVKNMRNLYRGVSDYKKSYQTRTNTVKDKKGDLVANSNSIVAGWRDYFSELLNVHGVNDGRQTEIHTAEPLVPEPSGLRLSWLLKI